jgi:hypothetical protein
MTRHELAQSHPTSGNSCEPGTFTLSARNSRDRRVGLGAPGPKNPEASDSLAPKQLASRSKATLPWPPIILDGVEDAEPMTMWPISMRVNKPENDDPSLLDRTGEPRSDWRTVRRLGSSEIRGQSVGSLERDVTPHWPCNGPTPLSRERSKAGSTDRRRTLTAKI